MENRHSNRYSTDQSIVCTFFSSQRFNDPIDGKVKNYCDSGLYAELQKPFKEGTVLLLRTINSSAEHSPATIEEGFRSISLVEVKWSKALSDNGVVYYGTGLKHVAV